MKHYKHLILLLFTVFTLLAVSSQAYAVIKPTETKIDTNKHIANGLYVKFNNGLNIRLREGVLYDNGTNVLHGNIVFNTGSWQRMHHVNEQTLEKFFQNAKRNLEKEIADPNLEYCVFFQNKRETERFANELNKLSIVEIALPLPKPVVSPVPPEFTSLQGYLNATVTGVGATEVWSQYNNKGSFVRIGDIEYSFNAQHEDLPNITYVGPQAPDPFNDNNHGTAVFGVLGSRNNSWGTTGIAHEGTFYFSNANDVNNFHNVSGAITSMLPYLTTGDIMLIEQQFAGPNYTGGGNTGLIPVDWFLPFYNAIVLAVGQGVVVVQTAGNGGEDLDAPIYSTGNNGHYPFLPANSTGAIMVGAGAALNGSTTPRSRLSFSNYGSRLDLQGWGELVTTTGYGALFNAEGVNRLYTNMFNGTSSAGPVVAGSAALLQSVYKAYTNNTLSLQQVKNILISTGHPQQSGINPVSQKIGPLPNVFAAVQATVGAPDFIGNISTTSSICLGGNIVVTGTNPINATYFSYQVLEPGAAAWNVLPYQTDKNFIYTPTQAGTYSFARFTWHNNAWHGPTNIVSVVVNSAVPTINISTSQTTICSGTNVTFTATATNAGNNPTYQWKVNGNNVGTNSNTFSSNSLINGSVITCELISNATCASPQTVTSNSVVITVNNTVVPTSNISATQTTICSGTNVTFTATATNAGNNPTYQWKVNGNNVGTNSNTFSSNSLANGSVVTCELISNATCASPQTATSNSIAITVNSTVVPAISISATQTTICSGTNVIFTATATNAGNNPTYQWKVNGNNVGTNSNTFSSNSLLANGSVVTCVLTSNAACASPQTATSNSIAVTVNNLPDATITASGSLSFCEGDSVLLSVVSGYNYEWNNNATTASIIVKESGIFQATVTDNNNCVAISNIVNVEVSNAPIATITPSANIAFCEGDSVELSASLGMLYNWSNGATTQSINVFNSGNYTVTITLSNNCFASSETVVVVENSLPDKEISVSGSNSFCAGDSVQLYATPFAENYLWNNQQEDASIWVYDSGMYYAFITDSNGCNVYTDTVILTKNNLPDVQAHAALPQICLGELALVYGSGASQFAWNNNVDDSVAFYPENAAWYVVTGTDSNNCTATDSVFVDVEVCVGIAENVAKPKVLIYPNPAEDFVVVIWGLNVLVERIVVNDVLGKTVLDQKPNADDASIQLQLKEFSGGTYVIHLYCTDKTSYSERFIVTK